MISTPDFRCARCFTNYEGELVEVYESFATTGFRIATERENNIRERVQSTTCSLCGESYRQVHEDHYKTGDIGVMEKAVECRGCGNWKGIFETSISSKEWLLPFIRDFCPHTQVPALTALLDEVQAKPRRVFSTTPKQFEIFVGSVLSSFINCEIYHVGRSRDGGIDLVAVGADQPMMIQVKRRESPNAVEGVDVVRLLFASMFVRGAKNGMLVTTAHRFTKDANDWVHLPALRDNSYQIDLVALDRLLHMTKSVRTGDSPPWTRAIPFWRGETPFIKGMTRLGMHDLMGICMKGEESLPLGEYLSQRDGNLYWSVDGGCMLRVAVSGRDQTFLFKNDERSQCWEVPTTAINREEDQGIGILPKDTDPTGDTGLSVVSGDAFYEVLHEAPVGFVEEMIVRWSANAREGAVSWGF